MMFTRHATMVYRSLDNGLPKVETRPSLCDETAGAWVECAPGAEDGKERIYVHLAGRSRISPTLAAEAAVP